MSAKANHFKLGLFVLGGAGAVLMALLLLGLGSRFRKPLMVETYLDQSVQGLEIGSKVNFRGVTSLRNALPTWAIPKGTF